MKKNKKSFLKKIVPFIINKYVISLIALIIWIMFFDKDDMFSQFDLSHKLRQLQNEKKYYETEIKKNKNDIKELKTNSENLKKFAREKYLMKKDNEEIFVIVQDTTTDN
ncbi:MAG: septum formation initiator family protein [Bacteroidota bacterium]